MNDFPELGKTLKDIRTKKGLSLSELSDLTGVSKTMLSQIERAESNPTIATVWKIANGLRIKFDVLLGNTEQMYEVKKLKDVVTLTDDDQKIKVYTIFPFSPMRGFEYFYGFLEPGCNYESADHLNSKTEHFFVSKGTVDLIVSGKKYHLNEGDSITFDSKEDHKYINPEKEVAKVHFLISY